jgi:hypothetical protein
MCVYMYIKCLGLGLGFRAPNPKRQVVYSYVCVCVCIYVRQVVEGGGIAALLEVIRNHMRDEQVCFLKSSI